MYRCKVAIGLTWCHECVASCASLRTAAPTATHARALQPRAVDSRLSPAHRSLVLSERFDHLMESSRLRRTHRLEHVTLVQGEHIPTLNGRAGVQ